MNDGGPAFPITEPSPHNGMSLRDWFAGMALQASSFVWRNVMTEEDVARNAYRVADAMLKERSK